MSRLASSGGARAEDANNNDANNKGKKMSGDAKETPRSALARIAVFAVGMYAVGRNYWMWGFVAYALYRLSITELGKRIRKTFIRDIQGLVLLVKVKTDIKRRLNDNRPLHKIFLDQVHAHPHKECAVEVETGRSVTYEQMNKLMNKYARYFEEQGYKNGDVVSLFMENSIDFIALWLGLSKIGVVSAFINSNLKLEPLAHSIRVAKSRCVITTEQLLPVLKSSIEKGLLPNETEIILASGQSSEYTVLEKEIASVTDEEIGERGIHFQNVLCYIYTSGTTGNPKPAVIKHFRYYWIAMGAGRAFQLRPDDRIYITMPLYHTAAGVMGAGSIIVWGATIVIRKKFSASNFWKDCVQHKATASQYIGEICRYLLAQKESPEERQHKVRVMWGNGLRPEIWTEFTGRFGIEKIGELYGSTEGNSNIVNIDNHVGACGFFPIYPYLTAFYPVRLVKVDEETGELIRDKNGLCVSCRPGETGEMVGLIKEKDLLLRFEGYVEKTDTAKKIYTNVFKQGDKVFASGDILFWDELGYLYFKDRRGDTFRWKGENCSTTEVEGILQPVKAVVDATVYGVEVGKMEGRAGMAGIVLADGVQEEEFLGEIARRLTENLAGYAIPVFVRICKEVERTGTFKLKKIDLQRAGFDLEKCKGDPVYYWDASKKGYSRLDEKMQKDIDTGVYARL